MYGTGHSLLKAYALNHTSETGSLLACYINIKHPNYIGEQTLFGGPKPPAKLVPTDAKSSTLLAIQRNIFPCYAAEEFWDELFILISGHCRKVLIREMGSNTYNYCQNLKLTRSPTLAKFQLGLT